LSNDFAQTLKFFKSRISTVLSSRETIITTNKNSKRKNINYFNMELFVKISELKSSMDNFIKNSQIRSLLVDGEWGVGKTHFIKHYFGIGKSRCKRWLGRRMNKGWGSEVYYASLFGKENLDEVHTELYYQYRKRRKIHLKLISKAVLFCPKMGDKLSSIIDDFAELKYRPKSGKGKSKIIIIDDFERKQIDESILLGYLLGLIDQGFKIIVLVNLNKNNSPLRDGVNNEAQKNDDGKSNASGLKEYKEKVFDRVYVIDQSQESAIEGILKDNYKYFLNCARIESSNLRHVIKANSLFCEIKEKLEGKGGEKEKGFRFAKKIDTTELCRIFKYCLLVVVENLTQKYTNSFGEYERKNSSKNCKHLLNFYFDLDATKCEEKALQITYYFIINNPGRAVSWSDMTINLRLLSAIDKIFLEDNWELLQDIYAKEVDLLDTDLLLLSDNELEKTIKSQRKYILETNQDTLKKKRKEVISAINTWFNYDFPIDDSEKEGFFNKLSEIGTPSLNSTRGNVTTINGSDKKLQFWKDYGVFCKASDGEKVRNQLNDVYRSFKDLKIEESGLEKERLFNSFITILRDSLKSIFNNCDENAATALLNVLNENCFFIGDLSGSIDEYSLKMLNEMHIILCELPKSEDTSTGDIKNAFAIFLKNQTDKKPEDKQLQRRVSNFVF